MILPVSTSQIIGITVMNHRVAETLDHLCVKKMKVTFPSVKSGLLSSAVFFLKFLHCTFVHRCLYFFQPCSVLQFLKYNAIIIELVCVSSCLQGMKFPPELAQEKGWLLD